MKKTESISVESIRKLIITDYANKKRISAWDRGCYLYAHDLLDTIESEDITTDCADMQDVLLNGASSWNQYSWSGCSLIYDIDIAERLCTPSELRKTRNGERRPNSSEEWLDVQARALWQAWYIVRGAAIRIARAAC